MDLNGWILLPSSNDEFAETVKKYKLQPVLVNDCLQPDHLPKFEQLEDYSFIIFRIYTNNDLLEADSVQELSRGNAVDGAGNRIDLYMV